jgi:hypothetical protein
LLTGAGSRRALKRIPHRAVGRFGAVRVYRAIVVVRSGRKRYAPIWHCRFRIELSGALKIQGGFVMIEAVKKCQPLIEVNLCFSTFGRDRMMVAAQSGVKLNDFRRFISMLVLSDCGRNKKCENEKN